MGHLIPQPGGDQIPDPKVGHVRREAGKPAMSEDSVQFCDAFPTVNGEHNPARIAKGAVGESLGPQRAWTPANRNAR